VFRNQRIWWAAYIEEMPGVIRKGRPLMKRENLTEALAMVIEATVNWREPVA